MRKNDINTADIYWYFSDLEETFLVGADEENLENFEQHWRGIQNAGFDAQKLAHIAKATTEFLVTNHHDNIPRELKRKATKCARENMSCWEIPTFKELESDNDIRLHALTQMGDAFSRLDAQAPLRFVQKWQSRFFEILESDVVDKHFIRGIKNLAGFKSGDRQNADIEEQDKIRLLRLIDSCSVNLNALDITSLLASLNNLHLVPSEKTQAKLLSRTARLMHRQVNNEKSNTPYLVHNKFEPWALSRFIFTTADMNMSWPDEMFEPLTELVKNQTMNAPDAARAFYGLAILHATTGDQRYKNLAWDIYNRDLKNVNLSDASKRQVFDSCLWFDPKFDCGLERPPEDENPSKPEKQLKRLFNRLGIETTDEPFIIQGSGHKVDITLITEDGKRQVVIEFDGPSHFHIYFDHEKPDKAHRVYNGRTLFQMALSEKMEPNLVIVHVPHSADRLGKMEGKEKKELYIERTVEKAKGDKAGRNKPAGTYVVSARRGRGTVLKHITPATNDKPMRTLSELSL